MKVNISSKRILLLFLSVSVGCNAASDASWWQRWIPSATTLQGVAWSAPLAIASQRFLMPQNKLPWYAYFIPGAAGTALGVASRSDQGLGQALVSSACNQIPSFIVAALLMAGEKWQAKNIHEANLKKFNELHDLIREYQIDKHRLLNMFEEELLKDVLNDKILFLLQDAYRALVSLYNKIIAMHNDLFNQWNNGVFYHKDFESQSKYITEVTYLTPAQEMYADYIAYAISVKSFAKDLENVHKEQLKENIKQQIKISMPVIVPQLETWGIIVGKKNKIDEEEGWFLKQLDQDQDDRLFESIFNRIKKYQFLKKYGDILELEPSKALEILISEYTKKINEFVSSILADRVSLGALNALYVEIKQTYQDLQIIVDTSRLGILLAPYDYIGAAIFAHVIKPNLEDIKLDAHQKLSKGIVHDEMSDVAINSQVSAIVQKSSLLKKDLTNAMGAGDAQRDERFIIKIIDIINQLREQEAREDELLTSELHDVLDL